MPKRRVLHGGIFAAIMYIVIGIVLCLYVIADHDVLYTAVGVLFMILGVVYVASRRALLGAAWIILGVVMVVIHMYDPQNMFLIVGGAIAFIGLMCLLAAIKPFNIGMVISSGVVCAIGAMLFAAKWLTADWYFVTIGSLFLANGLFRLVFFKLFQVQEKTRV